MNATNKTHRLTVSIQLQHVPVFNNFVSHSQHPAQKIQMHAASSWLLTGRKAWQWPAPAVACCAMGSPCPSAPHWPAQWCQTQRPRPLYLALSGEHSWPLTGNLSLPSCWASQAETDHLQLAVIVIKVTFTLWACAAFATGRVSCQRVCRSTMPNPCSILKMRCSLHKSCCWQALTE